ncbi:MAG: RraA family protein [Actinomycetota bacterium]
MRNASVLVVADVTTATVADACIRCDVPLRAAPAGVLPVVGGTRVAGRVLPARHYGSVDVFLEAFADAEPGDVLVVDNGGRLDEACVGDLTILEARAAGVAAVIVWGLHRDTQQLVELGLPVWSYGAHPVGPTRLDDRDGAPVRIGDWIVTREDVVVADDDGVVFVPRDRVDQVLAAAREIGRIEREQAARIAGGETLRAQTQFDEYLARRAADPAYTFRAHLRRIGGAIEE